MNRVGMMEYWNSGPVGGKGDAPTTFHHSTIPVLRLVFGVIA